MMKHRLVNDQMDSKASNRQDRRRNDSNVSANNSEAAIEDGKAPDGWIRSYIYYK